MNWVQGLFNLIKKLQEICCKLNRVETMWYNKMRDSMVITGYKYNLCEVGSIVLRLCLKAATDFDLIKKLGKLFKADSQRFKKIISKCSTKRLSNIKLMRNIMQTIWW